MDRSFCFCLLTMRIRVVGDRAWIFFFLVKSNVKSNVEYLGILITITELLIKYMYSFQNGWR